MTDRVDAAERLLATIEAGRAHVRTLALMHLPPGRAFAMELRAGGLLPQGSVSPRPSAPLPRIPDTEPATVGARSVAANDLPTVNVAAPAGLEVASPATQDNEPPQTEPTAGDAAARPAPDAELASSKSAESTETPSADTEAESSTDAHSGADHDDAIEVGDAPDEGFEAPISAPDDEQTGSHEPTLIQIRPQNDALRNTGDALPHLEADALEADGLEADELEADAFTADALDPLAGWGSDDEAATARVETIGDLTWGDPGTEPTRALGFDRSLAAELGPVARDTPAPVLEPDDEQTHIAAPDDSLLEAIEAADADPDPGFELDELDDDFELDAADMNWFDGKGELREGSAAGFELDRLADESVDPPSTHPVEEELQWSDGQGSDFALDDMEAGDDAEELDEVPHPTGAQIRLQSPAPAAAAAEQSLPTAGDDAQHTPAHRNGQTDEGSFATDFIDDEPDVFEAPPRVEMSTTPFLAVPRVVEPRSGDAVAESTGSAAIQILGVGQAQTLTPTLELGGEEDDSDASSEPIEESPRSDAGGFSLQFEEPEEEVSGPRIPVLTEEVVPHHQPSGMSRDSRTAPDSNARSPDPLVDTLLQEFIDQATAAEQKGNLTGAVVHYDDLLSHDPQHLNGYLGRGRCYVDLGDYGAAMSDFTRAEDIAPDSPEPLVEMGNLFFARKEYTRAITYYSHAIDLDDKHAMAFSRRGISFYHRKLYAEAHSDLKEAQRRDPSIPGIRRYIQMTSRKLKR